MSEEPATTEQEPILSLPNLLTLVRLPMAALVWWLGEDLWWLIGLMIAAAVSDLLDGWFARRMRARRERMGLPTRNLGGRKGRGAWLDPACDKLFVLSVIGASWLYYQPEWWLMLLIGTREILLVPVFAVYRLIPHLPGREHLDVRAGFAGKLATVMQFFALWSILLGGANQLGLALGAAFAGLLATLDYVRRGVVLMHEQQAPGTEPG